MWKPTNKSNGRYGAGIKRNPAKLAIWLPGSDIEESADFRRCKTINFTTLESSYGRKNPIHQEYKLGAYSPNKVA